MIQAEVINENDIVKIRVFSNDKKLIDKMNEGVKIEFVYQGGVLIEYKTEVTTG